MSAVPIPIDRSISPGALWTTFRIPLHGLLQWRRILVLLFLALLPLLVVFFFRAFGAQNIRVTPLYQAYLRIEFMTVMVYYSSVVIPITI
ncbi:MAG TPA: hypothetical protein PKD72_12460, partial [Gemmatales bacterium]|nr:hypothetical protein [Gemmatales bacterium]